MYVIELGVMMLLGLVVMFMVIRPLVRRVLAAGVVPALAGSRCPRLRPTPGRSPAGPRSAAATHAAQMIDVAQVQGQVHAQSVHRVGELAERNPQRDRLHCSPMAAANPSET